jgi:hypothetical protein
VDLPNDVHISGRVKANLYVECNQPDADISLRLVDLYPDGRSMLITDGIHRMRFRDGYTQADESFMSPGNIYHVEVELPFTNYTWKAGHQIKLYVGGNNAIRYNVNLQNGGTMYVAGDTNVANIQIHHNSANPSRIILPGNNTFLSVEDQDQHSFHVYPNPTSQVLRIKSSMNYDAVLIYDIQGKLMISQSGMEKSIDVSSLESGMYLIQIEINGQFLEKRFIKN